MANVVLRVSALVVVAFALALVYLRAPESGARSERPLCERCNVVLISFDTVRADHVGAYGYKRPTTPNVDALAARSAVFERAISQAPWTLPAHGSMLSGLYPARLGVLRYPATRILSDKYPTLGEMFQSAGYATAGFTGGGFVSDHYGFDRGFDIYATNGRRFEHNLDDTIDWVGQHKDKPFFLFFHGYDAHRPYYSKAADKKAMDLPAGVEADQSRFCLRDDRDKPSPERLEKVVRYYDASIHHGDRAIGVLLESLANMGLMDKTVILLTSDHGEEFFEHGNCDHVRFLYNESVHVPYTVYVPGFTVDGLTFGGLIPASISVARTLLDLVGIDHAMPGVTLLPMLQGKQKSFPVVYSEADSAPGVLGSRGRNIAMTQDGDKLIAYTDEGTDEAFDLEKDPGELEPLPERNLAYLMRQALRAWHDALKPLPRPTSGPRNKAKDGAKDGGPGSTVPADGESDGVEEGGEGAGADKAAARAARAEAKRNRAEPGAKPNGAADKPKSEKKGSDAANDEEEMVVPKELEESLKSLGYLE